MGRAAIDFSTLTELKCSACGETKPVSEFSRYTDPSAPLTGWRYYSRCKACNRLQCSKYGQMHKKQRNAKQRAWRRGNPERSKAIDRRARLRKSYGLTENDHAEMVRAQDGRCAICKAKAKLVVDHCHKSGRVRKMLCNPCNTFLGRVEAKPFILRAMRDYIRTHRPSKPCHADVLLRIANGL